VRIRCFDGASAEADFSENKHVSEGLFGLIIRWLNTGVLKKNKQATVCFISDRAVFSIIIILELFAKLFFNLKMGHSVTF